jgi:hypothetical protein
MVCAIAGAASSAIPTADRTSFVLRAFMLYPLFSCALARQGIDDLAVHKIATVIVKLKKIHELQDVNRKFIFYFTPKYCIAIYGEPAPKGPVRLNPARRRWRFIARALPHRLLHRPRPH